MGLAKTGTFAAVVTVSAVGLAWTAIWTGRALATFPLSERTIAIGRPVRLTVAEGFAGAIGWTGNPFPQTVAFALFAWPRAIWAAASIRLLEGMASSGAIRLARRMGFPEGVPTLIAGTASIGPSRGEGTMFRTRPSFIRSIFTGSVRFTERTAFS
jgi:hypothetical protein